MPRLVNGAAARPLRPSLHSHLRDRIFNHVRCKQSDQVARMP